ncbi:MAG: hypothetical protein PVH68_20425 [Armatimonadota bacterium]|jgi:hypothetical protein
MDYRLRTLNPITTQRTDAEPLTADAHETPIALPDFRQDCALVLRPR